MPTEPLLKSQASVSRGSIIVAVGLLATALLGALQALLIVLIVGEGDDTDAFLAAYSLYVVFALFGGSLRNSLAPMIGHHESDRAFAEHAAAMLSQVLTISFIIGGAMLIAAPLVGQLVAIGLPASARWTAVLGLAILAPAAALQTYAAAQAAVLTASRRLVFWPVAIAAAAAVGLGVSAAMLEPIGAVGAAIGLLVASVVLTSSQQLHLRKYGLRLTASFGLAGGRSLRSTAFLLISGASVPVALQLNLTIALAAISGKPSSITAYSYAFFATTLLLVTSSVAVALATLPDLINRVARDALEGAREHLKVVLPFVYAALLPTIVAYLVAGKPIVQAVFDSSLADSTIDDLFSISAVLCAMLLPAAVLIQLSTIALAMQRWKYYLYAAIAGVAIDAALVIPLSSIGVVEVAVGQAVAVTALTVIVLWVTYGARWPAALGSALLRSTPAAVLSLVIVAVRLPFGSDIDLSQALIVVVAGLALYLLLVILFWPAVGRPLLRALRSGGGAIA